MLESFSMIVRVRRMEVVDLAGALVSHAPVLTNNEIRDAAWVGDSGCGRERGGVWHMNLLRALAAHSEKGGATIQ